MKSFLEYVAHDVLEKYGHDLSRLAMVFPNKRASLFFNEHLARLAGRPVWSPAYITISDLFRSHSTLQTGDPIKLVCDLHKCFVQVTGIQESLDHFYGWGQVLLADFDDIDKNMADASKVFANLRDLHELDDVSYLTEEQNNYLSDHIWGSGGVPKYAIYDSKGNQLYKQVGWAGLETLQTEIEKALK